MLVLSVCMRVCVRMCVCACMCVCVCVCVCVDVTCFQGFFGFSEMQPLLRHFCVYHVNAPGQEEGALHLKPEYVGVFFSYFCDHSYKVCLLSLMLHHGLNYFILFYC